MPHKILSLWSAASFDLSKTNQMQLWESEIEGWPNCARCRWQPRMHRHGCFRRRGLDGEPVAIQRYICPQCRSTCSVLKDGMLPYRRLCPKHLQQCLDQLQAAQESLPKASSSLGRAVRHFQHRATSLHLRMCLPVELSLDPPLMAQRLWQALRRRHGDITAILRHLAAYCRSSLLHDYQSLAARS
jgi:transposase-like protein